MADEKLEFALFEHAVGYALFRVHQWEEIGLGVQSVSDAVNNVDVFCRLITLHAFQPFADSEAALANANAVSEGLVHADLAAFLGTHLPPAKKKSGAGKRLVAVADSKLAAAIGEQLTYIGGVYSGVAQQWLRGIRVHFSKLVGKLSTHALDKSQLSVGHSYSRSKVKFNVHRVDNMIIQSIALLDQLDKDINTFSMRLREWYSYHFPELYKLVPEQQKFVKCVQAVKDRKSIDETTKETLQEIIMDDVLTTAVLEAARTSMGMDISAIDLINVEAFANRVASLVQFRTELHDYLKDRMHDCAPNLAALIGEQVGARLISHAGSLTNLAKYPASTVQILGAEKALFRALKTRGNTPKYGLLFHSTYIGRAQAKNKGRISRYLANKCSIASRLDCFAETPVSTYGEHLRQQVEDRLVYYETGKKPRKNIEVMVEAGKAAVVSTEIAKKKARKRAKKDRKMAEGTAGGGDETMETGNDVTAEPVVVRFSMVKKIASNAQQPVTPKTRKRKSSQMDVDAVAEQPPPVTPADTESSKKKKKGRKSKADDDDE